MIYIIMRLYQYFSLSILVYNCIIFKNNISNFKIINSI